VCLLISSLGGCEFVLNYPLTMRRASSTQHRPSSTQHGSSPMSVLQNWLFVHFLHQNLLTMCNHLPIPPNPSGNKIAVIVVEQSTVEATNLHIERMLEQRKLSYPVLVGSSTEFPPNTTDQISLDDLTEYQQWRLYVQTRILRDTHEKEIKITISSLAHDLMKKGGARSDWTLDSSDRADLDAYCTQLITLCNETIPQMPKAPMNSHEVAPIKVTNGNMRRNTIHHLFHNPLPFRVQVTYTEIPPIYEKIQLSGSVVSIDELGKRQRKMHTMEDAFLDSYYQQKMEEEFDDSYHKKQKTGLRVPTIW